MLGIHDNRVGDERPIHASLRWAPSGVGVEVVAATRIGTERNTESEQAEVHSIEVTVPVRSPEIDIHHYLLVGSVPAAQDRPAGVTKEVRLTAVTALARPGVYRQ